MGLPILVNFVETEEIPWARSPVSWDERKKKEANNSSNGKCSGTAERILKKESSLILRIDAQ
ncbi:hypothetical protein [Pedobacter jamesrossensis]|uniref:Uncharacterized protein n=1 Tax=Pedobacter jamesrossensis TaxID=1908238 RepID=A0ABV8NQR7_9SPHI